MDNVIRQEEAVMNTTDPAKAPIGQAGVTPEDPSIHVGGDAINPIAESSIGMHTMIQIVNLSNIDFLMISIEMIC